jgi:uncharacterized zinc-type alcohol dehydrogenase-like protein
MVVLAISPEAEWEALLNTLKKNGRLVLVGFPDVALNSTDLVAHQLSITGSFLGNRATMREMLSFAQVHGITPAVELMPMSQVNEAVRRVRENKARYRIVLVNDTAAMHGIFLRVRPLLRPGVPCFGRQGGRHEDHIQRAGHDPG